MSVANQCSVCDGPINAFGAQGTRCHRCNEPCPICGKDVACCPHPLRDEQPAKARAA